MVNFSFLFQPGLIPRLLLKFAYTAVNMAAEHYYASQNPPVVENVKQHFDLIYSQDIANSNQIYSLTLSFLVFLLCVQLYALPQGYRLHPTTLCLIIVLNDILMWVNIPHYLDVNEFCSLMSITVVESGYHEIYSRYYDHIYLD